MSQVAGAASRTIRETSAPPPGAATTEAESLRLPANAGVAFADPAASGRRALLLWANSAVTVTIAGSPAEVLLRVRGDQCGGAPRVRVRLAGRTLASRAVTARAWTTLHVAVPARAAPGGGKLSVRYVNDTRRARCDRNLRLDWIAVKTAASVRVPVAAVPAFPAPTIPAPGLPAPGLPAPGLPAPGLPAPAASAGSLYVDPDSGAARQAKAWATTRPADAALIKQIADQPQAFWLGGWSGDVQSTADALLDRASGSRVAMVVYNIPNRDCGQYSAGGLDAARYRTWVTQLANGIAGRPALVVLEPDALVLTDCLTPAAADERLALLRDAVSTLTAGDTRVYLDAGHAGWKSAETVAAQLQRAGVAAAAGFALNTSNFGSTAAQIAYGRDIASRVGGKPFVIDTSRNGNGPAPGDAWCNPAGRALGARPTLNTGVAGVDGYLWVKRPGESDGTCNGGPPAGQWWAEYALGLVRNAG